MTTPTPPQGATKTCSACKLDLCLSSFPPNGKRLRSACRSCERLRKRKRSKTPGKKYGLQHPPTHNSLCNARQRCNSPKPQDGPGYVGIEYRLKYAEVVRSIGLRPLGTTLDRVDPSGHYEIGNIRWATPAEQAVNRGPYRPRKTKGERLNFDPDFRDHSCVRA